MIVPPDVTEIFPYEPGTRLPPDFLRSRSVVGGIGLGGGGVWKAYGPTACSLFALEGGSIPAPPIVVRPAGHAPVVGFGTPIEPPTCVLAPFNNTFPFDPMSPP